MTWHTLLKSKLFLAALMLAVGGFGYVYIGELRQRYSVENEIRTLQTQVQDLENKNAHLASWTDYLKSESYKEKEIRRKLNLQKPGEQAVLLPDDPQVEATATPAVQTREEWLVRWKAWWNYFFSDQ